MMTGNFANDRGFEKYILVFRCIPEGFFHVMQVGYTDLGSTYHMLGRESEAEEMLKKSIQLRHTALAYSNLATVYFFQQRYGDAVPIYEKLVADGTKDYTIWGNLGDAYRWSPGNAEKAAHAYRQAISLVQQAIGVNPRDARALMSLALYRARSGQKTEGQRVVFAFAPHVCRSHAAQFAVNQLHETGFSLSVTVAELYQQTSDRSIGGTIGS